MASMIIKLDLAGTTVHVNAHNILYYYAKQTESGKIVTNVFLTEKLGLEVSETPAEIDELIQNGGKTNELFTSSEVES